MAEEFDLDRDRAVSQAVDQAYPLFQLFGWVYGDDKPDRKRLRHTLNRLLDSLEEGDFDSTGTGRFVVRRFEEDGTTGIYLSLAEYWDN